MPQACKRPQYIAVSAHEVGVEPTGSPPTLAGRVGDSAAGRCLVGSGAELDACDNAARARRRHGRAARTRRRVARTDKARKGLLLTQPRVEGLAGIASEKGRNTDGKAEGKQAG